MDNDLNFLIILFSLRIIGLCRRKGKKFIDPVIVIGCIIQTVAGRINSGHIRTGDIERNRIYNDLMLMCCGQVAKPGGIKLLDLYVYIQLLKLSLYDLQRVHRPCIGAGKAQADPAFRIFGFGQIFPGFIQIRWIVSC